LVNKHDLIAASVLSANRNFEARVHQSIKANFLMSPPLVVAFAIAGRVDIDVEKDPIGLGRDGKPVYLRDIWPTAEEMNEALGAAADTKLYLQNYGGDLSRENSRVGGDHRAAGAGIPVGPEEHVHPGAAPYFENFTPRPDQTQPASGRRGRWRSSATRDHRSHLARRGDQADQPPAGKYLISQGSCG